MSQEDTDYFKRLLWDVQKRQGRSHLIWHHYVLKRSVPIAILVALLEYMRDTTGQPRHDLLVLVFCLAVALVLVVPMGYITGWWYWKRSRAKYDGLKQTDDKRN